jgi:threonyl-tRNA synthetase
LRILLLHVDSFDYVPVAREGPVADEDARPGGIRDGLVAMVAVEEGDDEELLPQVTQAIRGTCTSLSVDRVLLYPYAHLSANLAPPDTARRLVNRMAELLRGEVGEVQRAPFGWNKRFTLSIKGHPLAEQLKVFEGDRGRQRVQTTTIKKEYMIMERDGSTYSPEGFDLTRVDPDFRILVETEALGVPQKGGAEPEYIKRMKMFSIEWEPMSDRGHMRYGPEGTLMFDLVSEYSHQLVQTLGFPVYPVRGTNLFNLNERAIREHAELFGQRMYQVRVGNETFVMRYSACFQQFTMIRDWQLSYRHLPFGAFEVADSYRLEQSGELLLGFRVRKLHMPDLHVFCKDLEEAKQVTIKIHQKIHDEMRSLGREYCSLYNLTSRDFFEKNRDFFKELVGYERKPVLLAFYPEDSHYYWVLNIEYHIIDRMGRPREIGTVQIDVGNADRFDIKYVGKDGVERRPVILHTALLGSVERYLFALFDTALQSRPPMLPVWITPTQVRVIPVSSEFLTRAEEVVAKLNQNFIRCDLDDREESVARKVWHAETHWIPYIVMVGRREVETGRLSVRIRSRGGIEEMTLDQLISLVKRETEGKPFRPLPLPHKLSMRPVYS